MQHINAGEKVDWFRVLTDLDRQGWPLKRIEQELNIPYHTLYTWKSEATSCGSYENGCRLIYLWSQVTGRDMQQAPVINSYQ